MSEIPDLPKNLGKNSPSDGQPGNVVRFPAPPTAACTADDPTTQLIEALFAGYRTAIAAYQRAPTSARWRELRRSFLCWHTAFVAECEGGGKT